MSTLQCPILRKYNIVFELGFSGCKNEVYIISPLEKKRTGVLRHSVYAHVLNNIITCRVPTHTHTLTRVSVHHVNGIHLKMQFYHVA